MSGFGNYIRDDYMAPSQHVRPLCTSCHRNETMLGNHLCTQCDYEANEYQKAISTPTPVKENKMDDTSILLMLHIEAGAQTINVQFVKNGAEYTYLCDQKLFDELEVGDHVVVARKGSQAAVGKICVKHDTPQVEYDGSIHYKWAIIRVDLSVLDEIADKETRLVKAMRRAEVRKKLEAAVGELPEEVTALMSPVEDASE